MSVYNRDHNGVVGNFVDLSCKLWALHYLCNTSFPLPGVQFNKHEICIGHRIMSHDKALRILDLRTRGVPVNVSDTS